MKMKKIKILTALLAAGLLTAGCGAKTSALQNSLASPAEENTAAKTAGTVEVGRQGMEPVYGNELKDGVYPVTVDSSSSMFRITACKLTVEDGVMSAAMTMSGSGYSKVYMGTGEQAAEADSRDFIPDEGNAEGTNTFVVPVKALDMEIDCSAFSKKKEKWYDRVLVFRSDSLPIEAFTDGMITTAEILKLEDGTYTVDVALGGGSGRAGVESPAALRVEDKKAYATVIWSSSNYDYMKVDGKKYERTDLEGNSTFEIPVGVFDRAIPVIADTVAMSQPHEIEYTLLFDSKTLKKVQ